MKKVLLLDTNVASYPMYRYLVDRGYEVYVMGARPSDCLAKYTKNYINCNYSDIDLLKQKVEEYGFTHIVPGSNDMSYLCVSKLNSPLVKGVDSVEVTETINNKKKFREFATQHRLQIPKLLQATEVIGNNQPVIVKPVDAYSGRGVTVLKSATEQTLTDACTEASKYSTSNKYLIEEFVDGQLYSHTAFISKQKIFADFIVIEDGTTNKFTVDTSYVVDDFPEDIRHEIRNDIEKLSRELNLVDGLVHTQFIKTGNSFRLIEITRRCPGDLYNLLIEKSTGFNYAEYYTKPFLGEELVTNPIITTRQDYILRHTLSLADEITVIGIKYQLPVNIDLYVPMSITGDTIKQSPFGRIGLAFFKCQTKEELKNLYTYLIDRKMYNTI